MPQDKADIRHNTDRHFDDAENKPHEIPSFRTSVHLRKLKSEFAVYRQYLCYNRGNQEP